SVDGVHRDLSARSGDCCAAMETIGPRHVLSDDERHVVGPSRTHPRAAPWTGRHPLRDARGHAAGLPHGAPRTSSAIAGPPTRSCADSRRVFAQRVSLPLPILLCASEPHPPPPLRGRRGGAKPASGARSCEVGLPSPPAERGWG